METEVTGTFRDRHIGPRRKDETAMLNTVGVSSLDSLIDEAVPADIRLQEAIALPAAISEHELLEEIRVIGEENRPGRCHLGTGYYPCFTPPVILRNVLENPGWYTPYTPYQSEIAQGRLEALLTFQTMIMELTGMEAANASLLDEATAAAEAMVMLHRLQSRRSRVDKAVFVVAGNIFPQTEAVLRSRAEPLGLELAFMDPDSTTFPEGAFGALIQVPDGEGKVIDAEPFITAAQASNILVAVAADLLSLTIMKPPGEQGADIVFGSAQRFGVPMGFGGPHAAFFATRQKLVREAPGRIIGVSVDRLGRPAYRMALQTREQHIRREKAKSNICTAQALLATMAGMYAVWHGPEGLQAIGRRVHRYTEHLAAALQDLGLAQENEMYFDTLKIRATAGQTEQLLALAEAEDLLLRKIDGESLGVSLDETTTGAQVDALVEFFARSLGREIPVSTSRLDTGLSDDLQRSGSYLQQDVFNRYHSETEMMRFLKRLERKDVGLDTSMIPLGSCTMKLNAAAEMMPVTWPSFGALHPFVPAERAGGYRRIIQSLEKMLKAITGFAAVSFQPNSGAQGEYAGLMAIRAYHLDRGDRERQVVLIPSSAHGTNPASAVMAGMRVVVTACDEQGNIDLEDLRRHIDAHRAQLAGLMVTYPSTHGVFEESIQTMCQLVHEAGGQVYMDGANLNAQVGLTSPALIGADVCHINLHKTFAIPHGGGGPGMGPIAAAEHLAPYLPGHPVVETGGDRGIPAVSAAPWGSASILLISYAYLRMLGAEGSTEATRWAILNANYLKARLSEHYDVLFANRQGRVAHEMIFDLRPFKMASGVTEEDVAKRLMDYGFHAPTVSWPVPGTMMIEPTESESKEELDRFCDALAAIRAEIQAVINGQADREDNVLKNAPHAVEEMTSDTWTHAYTREDAAYPLPFVRERKVWPAVARIDNSYGDRHLVCTCPSVEEYA